MSDIALRWVETIKLGNKTASGLLWFYASRHTKSNKIELTNDYLAKQLRVSKASIIKASSVLADKKLIKKVSIYDNSTGAQMPSIVSLNIPQTFIDDNNG